MVTDTSAPRTAAEAFEEQRDLLGQLDELSSLLTADEQSGIQFQVIAPNRRPITIYSMENGEPITIPLYMVRRALATPGDRESGLRFRFTSKPENAPKYHQGSLKCFMHADSDERASGLLTEMGLGAMRCVAGKLATPWAKQEHERKKHRQESAAYQKYIADLDTKHWREQEEEGRQLQREQVHAMQALAERAADAPASKAKAAKDAD